MKPISAMSAPPSQHAGQKPPVVTTSTEPLDRVELGLPQEEPQQPLVPAPQVRDGAEAPESSPSSKRRWMAAGFAGLAVAGAATGLVGHTLLTAPVAPGATTPIVFQDSRFHVSPEAGHDASTAWRVFRRQFYEDDAKADLASDSNRFLPAPKGSQPPGELTQDSLRVVSWNLHRGQGREDEGSREQVPQMVAQIREAAPDVALLQEVPPWRAAEIVKGTGMDGYYTNTAPGQGNLILVHPDLEVVGNFRETLSFEVENAQDADRVIETWKEEGASGHPRSAQALRLQRPDGSTSLVWNTHLTNIDYQDGQRAMEARRLVDFLDEVALPGEPIFGGGDLNSKAGLDAVRVLEEHGYHLDGARIDWLATRGTTLEQVEHEKLLEGDLQLSDHPMVRGQVQDREGKVD